MSGKRSRSPTRSPQHSAAQSAPHGVVTQQTLNVQFAGPLPPPGILQGYEDVVPGSAERIMGWVEQESSHRRRKENRQLTWDNVKDVLGIVVAAALAAGILYGAWSLLRDGKKIEGMGAILTALAPLAAVFYIAGRRKA